MDVTLRDGGYKTNFSFPIEISSTLLRTLDNSGIEYIEIGYRNGSLKPIKNIGESGLCNEAYLHYCRENIKNAKMTVIAHPRNISFRDLMLMRDANVDAVRLCIKPENLKEHSKIITQATKLGFHIFLNLTHITNYTHEEILRICLYLSKFEIDAIYLADSNGNMTPRSTSLLLQKLSKIDIQLGFHAHDNLFLAQANCIAAIEAGATFIDASLNGLGKGAGNLATESIATYLNVTSGRQYKVMKLIETANLIKETYNSKDVISQKDLIAGVFNLSQDDLLKLSPIPTIPDFLTECKKYAQKKNINSSAYASL